MSSFAFADLFAGLGGFHVAASKLGGKCVFASEIKPHLQKTYEANFGIPVVGDIRAVPATKIPSHDALFAGFPCQPFSKAGEQLGWEDAIRGTLFWDVARVIRRHKPEVVLLENVANFVHHDNGNTYQVVKQCLSDLGYAVDYRKLSPHEFGVPQVRERVFILARRGKRKTLNWPALQTHERELSIHSILDKLPPNATALTPRTIECLETWQEFLQLIPQDAKLPSFPIWGMEIDASYPYDVDNIQSVSLQSLRKKTGPFGITFDGLTRDQINDALPNYARGKASAFPTWKQEFIRQNREFWTSHSKSLNGWKEKIKKYPPSLQKFEWNCQGEERNIWNYILQFRASGVRTRRTNTAPSLVAMTNTQIPIIGWEKRYLTQKEAARLQSLDSIPNIPPGWQGFEALGNAVNAKVVQKILELNL